MKAFSRGRMHDLALVAAVLAAWNMTSLSIAVGLSLFAVGLGLQVWSKACLARNQQLSTQGPYALCRHPFYLANAIMDLGLCALSGTWWLVLAYPVLFHFAYAPTIRKEEASLSRAFGEEVYAAYRRTTGRIVPTSLPLRLLVQGEVRLANLLAERQVSRIFRYSALPLTVLLAGRLWGDSGHPLTETNLLLAASIAGLNWLSFVIIRHIEHRPRSSFLDPIVAFVHNHLAVVGAALILALSIGDDLEIEELPVQLACAGLWLAAALVLARWRAQGPIGWSAGRVALLLAVGLFALTTLDIAWFIPLMGATVIGESLSRSYRPATRLGPVWRYAVAAPVGAACLTLAVWAGVLSPAHGVSDLADRARATGRQVLALPDHHLNRSSYFAPSIVSARELASRLGPADQARNVVVVAEAEDFRQLPAAVKDRLRIEETVRVGLEPFVMLVPLELADTPASVPGLRG